MVAYCRGEVASVSATVFTRTRLHPIAQAPICAVPRHREIGQAPCAVAVRRHHRWSTLLIVDLARSALIATDIWSVVRQACGTAHGANSQGRSEGSRIEDRPPDHGGARSDRPPNHLAHLLGAAERITD